MKKQIAFLIVSGVLSTEGSQATVLPAIKAPKYLVLQGIHNCLVPEEKNGQQTRCWPLIKPQNCSDFAWGRLAEYIPADAPPPCSDRQAAFNAYAECSEGQAK